MAEYIEREAVKKMLENAQIISDGEYSGYCTEDIDVDDIPAENVAPVVHGQWIEKQNPQWPAYRHDACSICGWWNTKNSMCYEGTKKPGHSLNYCPSCGAKMEEAR